MLIFIIILVITGIVVISKSNKPSGRSDIVRHEELKPLNLSAEPYTAKSNTVQPSKNTLNLPELSLFHFHADIKDLLWYADSSLKNIEYGQSLKTVSYNGVKIAFAIPGMEEPSMIFTKLSVNIPANIENIDRPPYYPTYEELSPEQKYIYLKFLENPYNQNINIGYVFILYYGLERHLLYSQWEKATEVIIKLRDVHKNKSFQQYSATALILIAIYRQKAEIAIKLLQSLDKDFEIDNFPAYLYLICAYSFDIKIHAEDLMRYASWFGFDNKNYIKNLPEIFEKELKKEIERTSGNDFIILRNILSENELNSLPPHDIKIFANTSLRDSIVTIPFIMESKTVAEFIYKLLSETHETVKKIAAEKRKSGELKPTPKTKTSQKRPQPTKEEYRTRLSNAKKLVPLPAAYSEMAIALRGLYKITKDEKYLKELYDTAVKASFYMDYSSFCEVPGFNIVEILPKALLNSLEYSYETMGYEKLTKLGVTDIKNIVGLWGEPNEHSTLLEKYKDIWHEYEIKYKRRNPY